MESKDSRKRKKRKRIQRSNEGENGTSLKPFQIVYRSKLSDRQLRAVLRCYAEGVPPKETMERCRISHVTVYRMFNDIRVRLMYVGLYTHPDTYLDGELAAEKEGGPFFDGESWRKKLEAWMGKRRGIHPENRIAYAAQAIFDLDAGKAYVPAQLYRLILFAIKATGPLNRPPRRLDPAIFEQEVARLMLAEVCRRVRKSPGAMKALAPGIAKLERQIEAYLAELRAESADKPNPPPSSQTLH